MTTSSNWASSIQDSRPIISNAPVSDLQTLSDALIQVFDRHPDRIQFVLPDSQTYTNAQFYALARTVARASIHFGLQPFAGASILAFNSIHWFAVDIGVTLAGAVPAGIYTTNKPQVISHILNHSRSRLIFVDDDASSLQKVLSIVHQCPDLKAIVVWGDVDLSVYPNYQHLLHKWNDFLNFSKLVPDSDLEQRIRQQRPEHVCKLIYTSGTTGPPKAVMISHDNVVFTARAIAKQVGAGPTDSQVSFLPCSHVAANLVDISGAILFGIRTTFAEPDALKGSLVNTLKKVRPTMFMAVPRVYEKIQEKLLEARNDTGPIKRAISSWAKSIGSAAAKSREAGDELMPWGYFLARMLVFDNVRKALGLDRCRLVVNTAAPLHQSTHAYFKSLDFRILDVYGMSEGTGPLTANISNYRAGTSGKALDGCEVEVQNPDSTGEGELCFRGRNTFVGYLEDPEESKKTVDENGFLHTGDLGRVDNDGFVTITGRLKELIVTAGGENIAPSLAESAVISELPAISRAFAVGDQKKFISCLLLPYMDRDGKLTGAAIEVNTGVTTAEEAAQDTTWLKYIEDGLQRANIHAISNAAKVRKFKLLKQDFSVESGELTPTMKVKRKVVVKKYADIIDSLYG